MTRSAATLYNESVLPQPRHQDTRFRISFGQRSSTFQMAIMPPNSEGRCARRSARPCPAGGSARSRVARRRGGPRAPPDLTSPSGRGRSLCGGGGKRGLLKRPGSSPASRSRCQQPARAMQAAGSELPRPPSPPAAHERDAEARPPAHGELQYLGQIEHILRCGFRKDDRTGTGTVSVFGMQARYSLRGDRGRARLGARADRVGSRRRAGSSRERPCWPAWGRRAGGAPFSHPADTDSEARLR